MWTEVSRFLGGAAVGFMISAYTYDSLALGAAALGCISVAVYAAWKAR